MSTVIVIRNYILLMWPNPLIKPVWFVQKSKIKSWLFPAWIEIDWISPPSSQLSNVQIASPWQFTTCFRQSLQTGLMEKDFPKWHTIAMKIWHSDHLRGKCLFFSMEKWNGLQKHQSLAACWFMPAELRMIMSLCLLGMKIWGHDIPLQIFPKLKTWNSSRRWTQTNDMCFFVNRDPQPSCLRKKYIRNWVVVHSLHQQHTSPASVGGSQVAWNSSPKRFNRWRPPKLAKISFRPKKNGGGGGEKLLRVVKRLKTQNWKHIHVTELSRPGHIPLEFIFHQIREIGLDTLFYALKLLRLDKSTSLPQGYNFLACTVHYHTHLEKNKQDSGVFFSLEKKIINLTKSNWI